MVFTIFTSSSWADDGEKIATVTNVKGVVKRLEEGSIKKSKVSSGDVVNSGDMVITYGSGQALIELLDGSKVVVDQGSKIRFASADEVTQEEGSVYYEIIKRNARSGLKIKTPFAIIGIKGTTFIINGGEEPNVALKEGLIGVESLKEEFELHRKKVLEEFERFKMQEQAAFEEYKRAQEDQIVEYVKAFELEAGKTIYFNDNRVDEVEMEEQNKEQFEHFKQLMQSF
jgi:hypothetical protein